METKDWFRKTTWSEEDARAFFDRLGRSRGLFRKSQYLRLQAYTLAQTGREELVRDALNLLDRLFVEFPHSSQLAHAHHLSAQCKEQLGNFSGALEEFRLALKAHAANPGFDPGTALELPWFIVSHGLSQHYDEAIEVLASAHIAFPVQVFKAAAVRALIAEFHRDHILASRHADEALQAVSARESSFRYHRSLGLVGNEYQPIIDRLGKIAAA